MSASKESTETRRQQVEGCAFCDKMKAEGRRFFPPHDASKGCRSGGRDHCTCHGCF